MKIKLLALIALLSAGVFAASPVSSIRCQQRWPWNGKVDITYTLTKTTTKTTSVFSVKLYGKIANGTTFELTNIEGDATTGIVLGDGPKRTTWDARAQLGSDVDSDEVKVAVVAEDVTTKATYLKLDLTSYQMTTSLTGPSVDEGASTKYAELWFRRIEPGTFVMGSSTNELGRWTTSEEVHTVTLSKAYYIGVFELTEGQYNRINADGTSTAVVPQGSISYSTLRGASYGATWPVPNDHRVDSDSFFGKLRTKTGNGLIFDLPTDAQWEAAARWKGTTGNATNDYYGSSVWNNGVAFNSSYSGLGDVAWYTGNSDNKAHEVGLKVPSTIGTYDMHGNAWEWCLDWFVEDVSSYVSNPEGPASGTTRLIRGGSYNNVANHCRMARRNDAFPSNPGGSSGCRVALVP